MTDKVETRVQDVEGANSPNSEHIPVLLEETLAGLKISAGARVIDGTVGGGGHLNAILKASAPDGKALGLDADPRAIERVSCRFSAEIEAKRVRLENANFATIENVARSVSFTDVDAILLDLGVSSYQLHKPARGFSFQLDGPLDMRMDPNQELTAADIVNRWSERDIADLLYRYGEERKSRRIARFLVANRPIHSTRELADLVSAAVGGRGSQRIHPATRTFQALRIAVNQELTALRDALPQCLRLLASGGRLAVISFHSLEDRIVKRWMQAEAAEYVTDPTHPMGGYSKKATIRIITRKPIVPGTIERTQNPRSRSAKLRIAEKIGS